MANITSEQISRAMKGSRIVGGRRIFSGDSFGYDNINRTANDYLKSGKTKRHLNGKFMSVSNARRINALGTQMKQDLQHDFSRDMDSSTRKSMKSFYYKKSRKAVGKIAG